MGCSAAIAKSEDQVEVELLLDVVVGEGTAVLELLASENEALLVGRDAFLVLDLGLDILNSVRGLDVQGDGLASEGLHEDLHTTAESKDQVKGGLLLNVVVRKSAAILKLLAGKNESLLVGRDALLVLDLGLHILNGVGGLNIKGDGLAGQSLDEDLHTTAESQNEVES